MSKKTGVHVTKAALRVLKIADIQYDPAYQRGVVGGHKKIVADFDPDALGIPVVAQREDGSLWCVDGRQRMAALLKLGKSEVRAEVFASQGPEHEARVFRKINRNRTKLTAQQLFFAALAEGDKTAWAIKDIGEKVGWKFVRGSANATRSTETEANCVRAYSAIERSYKTAGPEGIRFIFECVWNCWPGDPMRTRDVLVFGLAEFYRRHDGRVDQQRLIEKLNTTTPAKLMFSAGLGVGSGGNNMADIIERMYRKRGSKK